MRNVEILKRNRVYYKAKMYDENWERGWEFKLKIDEASEKLGLGQFVLILEDISVVTKYGKDIIYRVKAEVKEPEKICTFKHHLFNKKILEKCRNLGGKWDDEEKVWTFSSVVEEQVEELEELYNEKLTVIDIVAKDDVWAQPEVSFLGYPLFYGYGRDSGARLASDIIKISGEIRSSGSMKNWVVECEKGSIFRLTVSKNLIKKAIEINSSYLENWEIKFLEEDKK